MVPLPAAELSACLARRGVPLVRSKAEGFLILICCAHGGRLMSLGPRVVEYGIAAETQSLLTVGS